jgi:hypothetical protein
MAADSLTGNMPTEKMLFWFEENKIETGLDSQLFGQSMVLANKVFTGRS